MAEADAATTFSMVSPKQDGVPGDTTRAALISQSSGKKASLSIRRDRYRAQVEIMLITMVTIAAIRSEFQSCSQRCNQKRLIVMV